MLQRMEQVPSASFTGKELGDRDLDGFQRLQRERLISRSAGWPRESSVVTAGRLLTAVPDTDGTLECIDEHDIEFDPVPYDIRDLAWRLDVEVFGTRMREANGLTGLAGWLHERLYLFGEPTPDRAVVLALLADEQSGSPLLHSLPSIAQVRYQRFLAVCPAFSPTATTVRSLESIGVLTAVMNDANGFLLPPWPTSRLAPGDKADGEFEHNHDYTWVRIRGTEFDLTEAQAMVVKTLHEAWRQGGQSVSWQSITMRLPGLPAKMSDVFKNVRNWNVLIVPMRRGLYRLNLQ